MNTTRRTPGAYHHNSVLNTQRVELMEHLHTHGSRVASRLVLYSIIRFTTTNIEGSSYRSC